MTGLDGAPVKGSPYAADRKMKGAKPKAKKCKAVDKSRLLEESIPQHTISKSSD